MGQAGHLGFAFQVQFVGCNNPIDTPRGAGAKMMNIGRVNPEMRSF